MARVIYNTDTPTTGSCIPGEPETWQALSIPDGDVIHEGLSSPECAHLYTWPAGSLPREQTFAVQYCRGEVCSEIQEYVNVPEPSGLLMLVVGIGALALARVWGGVMPDPTQRERGAA